MKLKQVVGSMFLLGLASASAFADDSTQAQLDSMKAQIAKMEAAMNQNQPGGFQQADGWFNRITVSGQANIDGSYANRSPVIMNAGNSDVSDIYVNNANLFIDAQASDWTKIHVGLVYGQNAYNFVPVKAGYYQGNTDIVDEAYVNIGNFAKSPFFLKAGKQRVAFGDYQPYADITPSLTQLLSETTATAATVGFVDSTGVNGSLYTFRGLDKAGDFSAQGLDRVQNWGASLGFNTTYNNGFGMKLGAQYLNNMADVNFINQGIRVADALALQPQAYTNSFSGLALNVGANFSALDASVKYVAALQRSDDIARISNGNVDGGAKPSAWGADAGYTFPTMGHTSRVGVGYQGSSQASQVDVGYGMPQIRYLANYTVNVSKFTDVGFELRNDRAYGASQGGNGNNATTGTVRLAVKFA